MPRKCKVDWDAVELDWRARRFESDRKLATHYGIAAASLRQHAREHDWNRDLIVEIRERTSSKLAADALPKDPEAKRKLIREKTPERALVESASEEAADIIRHHRRAAAGLRVERNRLFQRYSALAAAIDIDLDVSESDTVLAINAGIGLLNSIAKLDEMIANAERRAYSIDDDGTDFGNGAGITQITRTIIRPGPRSDG